jgi:hypothetical protein
MTCCNQNCRQGRNCPNRDEARLIARVDAELRRPNRDEYNGWPLWLIIALAFAAATLMAVGSYNVG